MNSFLINQNHISYKCTYEKLIKIIEYPIENQYKNQITKLTYFYYKQMYAKTTQKNKYFINTFIYSSIL